MTDKKQQLAITLSTVCLFASLMFVTMPTFASPSVLASPAPVVPADNANSAVDADDDSDDTPSTNKSESATSAASATSAVNDKTANASSNTNTPVVDTAKDPYQPFNRAMFTFNDKLDKFILKPIATLYNKIMPKPLNMGIHNFYVNIGTVTVIANDVLQANFYQATSDLWRLGINTTIGVVGLFDMASRMQLEPYQNDFGLTLARWGYTNSNYLVLPFFGSNTIRDGIGIPVDYFVFSVYPRIKPESRRYQIYALGVVDKRAQLLKYQDVMEEAAVDRYVFVRDAYMQRRAYQIDQNNHRSYSDLQPVESSSTDEGH